MELLRKSQKTEIKPKKRTVTDKSANHEEIQIEKIAKILKHVGNKEFRK